MDSYTLFDQFFYRVSAVSVAAVNAAAVDVAAVTAAVARAETLGVHKPQALPVLGPSFWVCGGRGERSCGGSSGSLHRAERVVDG